jgi:hypothetical protein
MMSETIYVSDNGNKRKATAKEITQIEKDRTEYEAQARLIEAEQTKKDSDRASAMAKLSKLGLTDDEIARLIP